MNLYNWKKEGIISIWRYEPFEKNYPGWHMTADEAGYCSLENLLLAVKYSSASSKRTVNLDKPKEPVGAGLKKTLETKLVIETTEEREHWSFENRDGKLCFTLGLAKIDGLLKSLAEAKAGAYDFSTEATGGQNLWFW